MEKEKVPAIVKQAAVTTGTNSDFFAEVCKTW